MSGWRFSNETISFAEGLDHLKHAFQAIESEELKAHLKTTGIMFKGVQYEFSKLNDKVGGIQQNVDTSLGGMITKTEAATNPLKSKGSPEFTGTPSNKNGSYGKQTGFTFILSPGG